MALKGTTKIELTNVKTGQKEVIEKDNLVTNAIADILTMNPFAYQFSNQAYATVEKGNTQSQFRDAFLPVCPNLFGGILLYEDALEEKPEKYYAPFGNELVGYSSNNVNSETDAKRGSMNQTESGMLEDNSGYRFVFDFTTSQANGTISALGLTSRMGGVAGYGSAEDANSSRHINMYSLSNAGTIEERNAFMNLLTVDYEKNTGYAVYLTGDNAIAIAEVQLALNRIGLVGDKAMPRILNQAVISTEVFGKMTNSVMWYGTLIADNEGYVWGFQHNNNASGNSSGDATVNWVKIKLDDGSFEEGTWTLPLQLSQFAYNSYASVNGENLYFTSESRAIIHEGHLYCYSYDLKKIYRVNLSNITDIFTYEFEDKSVMTSNVAYSYQTLCHFNYVGNVIAFSHGYINGDKVYKAPSGTAYKAWALSYANKPSARFGPFCLATSLYTRYANPAPSIYMLMMTPYLATINNLPTPVQKTADKTMKITYILREES